MSQVGTLEAGNRHDLRVGLSPDAPDEGSLEDDGRGMYGYAHSYESSSRYDGPGLRIVLFLSGCLLRCQYCHNPDTWHLKDGTYISAQQVLDRLAAFAPALRTLGGGLTVVAGNGEMHVRRHQRSLERVELVDDAPGDVGGIGALPLGDGDGDGRLRA